MTFCQPKNVTSKKCSFKTVVNTFYVYSVLNSNKHNGTNKLSKCKHYIPHQFQTTCHVEKEITRLKAASPHPLSYFYCDQTCEVYYAIKCLVAVTPRFGFGFFPPPFHCSHKKLSCIKEQLKLQSLLTMNYLSISRS